MVQVISRLRYIMIQAISRLRHIMVQAISQLRHKWYKLSFVYVTQVDNYIQLCENYWKELYIQDLTSC